MLAYQKLAIYYHSMKTTAAILSFVATLLLATLVSAQAPPGKLVLKRDADKTIENFWQVSPRIYSGGEPASEAAFKRLTELGIRTVVSVDGAAPNVELARRHGLRYIHIPIGYDAVPRDAQLQVARVVQDVKGPLFIHCHHGQHRGPTIAALACIAEGDVSAMEAEVILKNLGTSKDYAGLWRDVKAFKAPAKSETLPPLVETAKVDSLATAMAKLGRHWDQLKLCREAKWQAPATHPDLVVKQEAFLVWEQLRESGRHLSADHSAEFRTWLSESETAAKSLADSLKQDDLAVSETHYQTLVKSCKQCHVKYRDQ